MEQEKWSKTCGLNEMQVIQCRTNLPWQVCRHSVQRLEILLFARVHILSLEQLEHLQLLLPCVRPAVPFLVHQQADVSQSWALKGRGKAFESIDGTGAAVNGCKRQRKVSQEQQKAELWQFRVSYAEAGLTRARKGNVCKCRRDMTKWCHFNLKPRA